MNVPTALGNTLATIAAPSTKAQLPLESQAPGLPTTVKVTNLSKALQGYHDAHYLLTGFTEGFLLDFQGESKPLTSTNAKSAYQNPDRVDIKLAAELALGRIAGPFPNQPLPDFKSSPLALRPKSDGIKYRLLHNLSYPYDTTSVNGGIPPNKKEVHYQSFQDATKLVQKHAPAAFLAKTDIADAFRIIPLHPSQYHLTGFYWKGYYYDRCLPPVKFLNGYQVPSAG